ncbi:ankyrin repeat domain-containing protein [Rhizobium leguminosarum]|uniref:ankyrin repeat domain-containing protein n=1 Tax=Rhizobium leguminosarum TaxID=384 RepID=UPI001C964411|nr:ankyrin repeat domain-containing protein [Rhizobium leguminosarum]MBY5637710.1 ankyrin repeat domain-containing protein [Rhizobium leguminosarum]
MQTASAEEAKKMLRAAPGAYVRCYEGYTPLHVAISAKNPAAVVAIAESGADLNAKNEFGSTPMHVAVMASRADLVELLIKLGANKEALGPDNETPLAMAKSWNETTIVDLLVSSGARF